MHLALTYNDAPVICGINSSVLPCVHERWVWILGSSMEQVHVLWYVA